MTCRSSQLKQYIVIVSLKVKSLLLQLKLLMRLHIVTSTFPLSLLDPQKMNLIDNLKNLNQFVKYQHIMESLQSAVQLIQKDYWIAVLDLKDAFPMYR